MERTYIQKIIDSDGAVVAERELYCDHSEETYKRPVFLAFLMEKEDEFLQEIFKVRTTIKGDNGDE